MATRSLGIADPADRCVMLVNGRKVQPSPNPTLLAAMYGFSDLNDFATWLAGLEESAWLVVLSALGAAASEGGAE